YRHRTPTPPCRSSPPSSTWSPGRQKDAFTSTQTAPSRRPPWEVHSPSSSTVHCTTLSNSALTKTVASSKRSCGQLDVQWSMQPDLSKTDRTSDIRPSGLTVNPQSAESTVEY